jgi:hypothetical protein
MGKVRKQTKGFPTVARDMTKAPLGAKPPLNPEPATARGKRRTKRSK